MHTAAHELVRWVTVKSVRSKCKKASIAQDDAWRDAFPFETLANHEMVSEILPQGSLEFELT